MAVSIVLGQAILLSSLSLSHTLDVCSLVNKDQLKVVSDNEMGFADANAWAAGQCDSGRLPDICSNLEDLGNNISTWIAMQRMTVHWQWINGSKGNNDYDCSLEGYWCTPIEGQCFCVAIAHNWYDARAICKNIGGSLAIPLTASQRKRIISSLKRNPPVIMTNNFLWIGLHGEDWQETSGPRAGKPVMINKFAPVDISNPPRGNCAVSKNNTWHVVSCQGKNHAVSVSTNIGRPTSPGYQREYSHVSVTVVLIELSLIQWITAVN